MSSDRAGATLVLLKFASKPATSLSAQALGRVVCQAWAHNTRCGITGEIALRDGMIYQTLEGEFADIVPLASRILSDTRHHQIAIDCFCAITTRHYHTWNSVGFEVGQPVARVADGSAGVIRLIPGAAGHTPVYDTAGQVRAARARTY